MTERTVRVVLTMRTTATDEAIRKALGGDSRAVHRQIRDFDQRYKLKGVGLLNHTRITAVEVEEASDE